MKKVSILAFILIATLFSGCNSKSKPKDYNATSQRSEEAKAMDSDPLPEGGSKKLPMF
jgi:uncharacterized lipoprotein